MSNLSVHVTCGRGSVILWRQCYILCTSGFVDDATGIGENHRRRMFRRVRQVAVPGAKLAVSNFYLFCRAAWWRKLTNDGWAVTVSEAATRFERAIATSSRNATRLRKARAGDHIQRSTTDRFLNDCKSCNVFLSCGQTMHINSTLNTLHSSPRHSFIFHKRLIFSAVARYNYAVVLYTVCPSVHLYVTKTTEHRITQKTLYDSPAILVRSTPVSRPNKVGLVRTSVRPSVRPQKVSSISMKFGM